MKIKNIYAGLLSALLGLGAMTACPVAAEVIGAKPGMIAAMQGSPQRRAAEEGLQALQTRFSSVGERANAARIFAVDDEAQLRRAIIGYGFQVNLLDPNALLAGATIDTALRPSDEWRFLVSLDGRPVGLVTVANMQGRWQMVMAGASEMAREINAVTARYAHGTAVPQMRFIRSQQGVMDFIQVTVPTLAGGSSAVQYAPLLSARDALTHYAAGITLTEKGAATVSEAQILPTLRDSISNNLRHFQAAR